MNDGVVIMLIISEAYSGLMWSRRLTISFTIHEIHVSYLVGNGACMLLAEMIVRVLTHLTLWCQLNMREYLAVWCGLLWNSQLHK